jgi:hypothetical protein
MYMKTIARIVTILILNTLCYWDADSQSVSGVVNSYYSGTAVGTAANTVTVSNAAGLSTGQLVLIIQMKGATIDATNTATYGDITSINAAGTYEFNSICSISGNEVWLQNKMLNSYDPSGKVQLITYPSNPSLTVSGLVTAKLWDTTSGTGGVVVLAATNSITLNADVNVSGQGFIGGVLVNYPIPPYNCDFAHTISGYFYNLPVNGYNTGGTKGEGIANYIANEQYGRGKLASGGGGGDNSNSGGAGGGNFGAGGAGGQRAGESNFDCHAKFPGIGGLGLSAYGYTVGANRIFMGGGGGSGEENNGAGEPGANGGGIIILSAPTIVGNGGQLVANGLQPTNPINSDPLQAEGDGGGGGGAGGTIILNATTITGAITAQANGGQGSNASNFVNDCTGPGGGGGGGVIWAAGSSFPAVVSASASGGVNGVVSPGNSKVACRGLANGATSGAAGASQIGYVPNVATVPVCVVLASPALQTFTGTRSDSGVALSWAFSSSISISDIRAFILERANDSGQFQTLATLPMSDVPAGRYIDPAQGLNGSVSYRLAWQDQTGAWSYSRILHLSLTPGPDASSLTLQPNPATDQLTVTVYSWTADNAAISIYNVLGQSLISRPVALRKGMNTFTIPLGSISAALYYLALDTESGRQVRGFVKR